MIISFLKKSKTWPQLGKGSVRTDHVTCFHSSALSSVHGVHLSSVSPPVSQTLLQGSCLFVL